MNTLYSRMKPITVVDGGHDEPLVIRGVSTSPGGRERRE